MKNINDGGPAYPVQSIYVEDQDTNSRGMSLRDYFAGQAIQALLREANPKDGMWHLEANAAYEIADAMLKARKIDK